jgi:hypothetical protein
MSEITYNKLKNEWKKYAVVLHDTKQTICFKHHYIGTIPDDNLEEIYFYNKRGFKCRDNHLYKVGENNQLIAINPTNPERSKAIGELIIAPSNPEKTSCS